MLASSKKKIKPKNDSEFCKRAAGKGPKNFRWLKFYFRTYDDDKA
jgi:ubiquitin-conjugating enzyme E2 W